MKPIIKDKAPLKIVGDAGLLSETVADGRFIVLLIIDHDGRSDIEDLFKIHSTTQVGDVKVKWGTPFFSRKTFWLNIEFLKPLEVEFDIEFDVDKHGILVENIINSKAVYLQLGKEGDRLKDDLTKQKILVEIPDTDVKKKWRYWWEKSLIRKYKSKGYRRKEAKKLAENTMNEIEKFKHLKMP